MVDLEEVVEERTEPRDGRLWQPDVGGDLVVLSSHLEGLLDVGDLAELAEGVAVKHHLGHLLAAYAGVASMPPSLWRVRRLFLLRLWKVEQFFVL